MAVKAVWSTLLLTRGRMVLLAPQWHNRTVVDFFPPPLIPYEVYPP